jgi:hypothetical protein
LEGCRFPYYEISLDQAAQWFSENGLPLPPILIEDLEGQTRTDVAPVVRQAPLAVPRGDQKAAAPASGTAGSEGNGEDEQAPDPDMFRAYLASENGIRQTEIATQLNVSQTTVHRYIRRVKEWIAAGNKVPGLEDLSPRKPRRAFSVDPQKMERHTEDDAIETADDE